ncbi:MAG: hypothetical protein ACW97P_03855 [Candidatus Hodarchaeales archaeon]
MDTDTLQEKYNRSEEALRRLKEDITDLISNRVEELKKSKDYLSTLIKEKEAVHIQNTEQEAKIATLKDNIEKKKSSITKIKNQQMGNIQEIKEKEDSKNDYMSKYNDLIQIIEKNKNEIKNLENEIEQTKKNREEYQEKIGVLEKKLSEEINLKESEIATLSGKISIIQKENGVLSFLLEESAEDIPEVEILADLMKNGRSTQDQLKKSLESKISPVMITRTLGRMIENGFIIHHSNDESYSVK